MSGLFRNDPTTREGKYPVLLRRDGTVPEWEWFVLGARDPAAIAAIRRYAEKADQIGLDPVYVRDLREMADLWESAQYEEKERRSRVEAATSAGEAAFHEGWFPEKPADPDGPRHRADDPRALTFPSTLAEYTARVRSEALHDALAACREVRDSDAMRNPDGSRPNAAAGCCGAIEHIPGFNAVAPVRAKRGGSA
jgi:hypothetical protein